MTNHGLLSGGIRSSQNHLENAGKLIFKCSRARHRRKNKWNIKAKRKSTQKSETHGQNAWENAKHIKDHESWPLQSYIKSALQPQNSSQPQSSSDSSTMFSDSGVDNVSYAV